MRDPYRFPKIRHPINVRAETFDGNEVIILSCPLGLVKEPLVLIGAVGPLLYQFDGTNSLESIVEQFSQYGVHMEMLNELVNLLDSNLFIEAPTFLKALHLERTTFLNSPVRASSLAGAGFSSRAPELKQQLESYLHHGAKKLRENGVITKNKRELFCLISPHIDYHRGGENYGMTYTHLKGEEHSLYILCGTSHQYSPHTFHLTKKHFDTPLGTLKNAVEYVEKLSAAYPHPTLFADEYLHKQEHSLELQAPFLAHLRKEARILPFLIGSFYSYLQGGTYPEDDAAYDDFAAALTACVQEAIRQGERVCFVAGVDMAHVGAYFGDPGSLSPEQMADIRVRDEQYLQCILSGDHHALWDHIAEDGDARKICGFPTLYLLLDVFHRMQVVLEGTLYDYRQAVNYQNDCAVTFAGLGLYLQNGSDVPG